jgi:hypothetical protein
MTAELPIGISTGERPLDAAPGGVASPLPGGHLEGGALGGTARQALPPLDSDFDLRHIQPAGMVRGVVELDPAQECRGRLHAEHFFKALPPMNVEVVQDQLFSLPARRRS